MLGVNVLALLQQAVPQLSGPVADMPIPVTYGFDSDQVTKFGLSGESGARTFNTSLEIFAGSSGAVPVNAIFDGQVSWIGLNIAIEPPRDDGSVFLTRRPGLLLKVHPRTAIKRLINATIDDPLEYPFPFWVLYEGVAVDPALAAGMQMESFATADFFAFDSFVIPAAAQPLLNQLAVELDANPNLTAMLTGYADAEGPANHNVELGLNRAAAIKDYLVNQGVDEQRIETRTLGEANIKLQNAPSRDAAGINRRVEIELRLEEISYVAAGDVLGQANDSVAITIFDPLGYFFDPLALVLMLRPDLAQHPLAGYRDQLCPIITSHRIHVVSDNAALDGSADSYPHFSYYDSLDDAIGAARVNDTIWIDRSELDINVTIPHPLTIVGKPRAGGALPEIVPLDSDFPIIQAQFGVDKRRYGLRIMALSFSEGRAATGGCAFDFNQLQNVHISNCRFKLNLSGFAIGSTGNGGAIKLLSCKRILIESCFFQTNHGKHGGAIYAEDCDGLVVTGRVPAGLDALRSSEANLIVPAASLVPGTVSGIPGVLTGEGFSSIFVENNGGESGGAIALKNSSFRIRRTFFGKNTCSTSGVAFGGAISVQSTWDAKRESLISNCVAVLNSANFGGGLGTAGTFSDEYAINGNPNSFQGGCLLLISDNVWHQNKAVQIGGGMHLVTGQYRVNNNRISNNEANRNGGGLSLMSSGEASFTSNRFLFNLIKGNDANQPYQAQDPTPNAVGGGGGGAYISFWTLGMSPKATFALNRFISNTSRETGGAIRATCGAQVTLKPGNLFQDNIAFIHGGAIALNSASLTIEANNQFLENSTRDGRTVTEPNRFRGGHGGAIYCYAGKVAAETGDDLRFASCAADGTGLVIAGSSSEPVLFVGNSASRQGGAIYIEREDSLLNVAFFRKVVGGIREATFESNSAAETLTSAGTSYSGSAIAIIHMDEPATIPVPLLMLQDLEIRLLGGVGLYLLGSVQLAHRSNISYVDLPGATGTLHELIQ